MDNHPIALFEGTISTLSRSLDLRARRHEMILQNVTNADTPGYKPFSMDVEEMLQNEVPAMPMAPMARTDARHFQGEPMGAAMGDEVDSAMDDPLLLRGDDNGVDIDLEMTELAKNGLLYKASAQIVGSKFKGLKNVISGGTK